MQIEPIRLKDGARYQSRVKVEEDALPRRWRNWPFVFVHYPRGWVFDESHGFLPDLSEITAKPGVNGVGEDLSLVKAYAGCMKKGGLILDPKDPRFGEEWADYVIWYPVKGGGRHFCFKGQEFEVLPDGEAAAIEGSAKLTEFRVFLRDQGLVHRLTQAVFNKLMQIEAVGLARKQRDSRDRPHLVAEVEAKQVRIAKMRAAWDAYQGTTAPTVNTGAAPAKAAKLKNTRAAATVETPPALDEGA